jgi:RHS repeat-associated protein
MDYRIGRSGGSLGNRSFFLEGEHLESEYSGSQLQARYFRGSTIDELVAAWLLDADGKTRPYLFHQDQVTSTTAISGHNGGTAQSAKYAAFGQVQAATGSSVNRQGYTGREEDGTGLMYYRARYYDSSIGRFISEDPLGYAAGVNFYAYCSNSPVDCSDPTGLIDWRAVGKASIDLAANGAGLVTGGVLTFAGAALKNCKTISAAFGL